VWADPILGLPVQAFVPALLDKEFLMPSIPLPVRPRYRGRKEPKNLLHLIRLSHLRHGAMLKALPRVTPATWDSRTQGWIGPIKDQAQCGSCWDFSGTGVCEVAYNKAGVGGGASLFILSEEYTLDCGQNGGCGGDDNTTVLAWAKATGLPLTAAYGAYTAGGGTPGTCDFKSGMTLYQISDWGFADSNGGQGVTSVADIKAVIMAHGCVGAAIAADDAFEAWGDNSPSMSSPFQGSGSTDIDHDIMLVGWQDDSTAAGGSWILRNSWGSSWGVGGYMAIAYGANLVGTESVFAVLNAPGVTGRSPAVT
jgi:C1A family cysteine protease